MMRFALGDQPGNYSVDESVYYRPVSGGPNRLEWA